MLTIAILFILFIGAYSGYKNGIIIGLLRTIGYAISFIFAMDYHKILSEYIYLVVPYPTPFAPVENPYHYYDADLIFSLDRSYYYLVSLLAILLVGWLATRLVSQLFSYFTEEIIIPEPFNGIGGSIMGLIVHYMGIFLLLFVLSTIPYDLIQNKISESWLADTMLTSSPGLSERAYQEFVQEVHEEEIRNQPIIDIEEISNQEDRNE